MRVERLGDGEPEVAVVAAIHGDEPCGVRAVESIISNEPAVERPVLFVVANEEALDRNVRYVEEDLNRAFPGDPDGGTHESRLAAELTDLLEGCETLSIHSTQSYEHMFAIVRGLGEFERRICSKLSVEAVVDGTQFDQGRLFSAVPKTIEIEAGFQGSQRAAANATQVTREFLSATGVLPGPAPERQGDLPVFELERQIPKDGGDEYEVYAANFEAVAAGEPFAATDGQQLTAPEGFYPVLLSAEGYEDQFGYAASLVDHLS
ncbi:succinylglutamate desuccinylase/aspartoacylase family protein [Halobacteriales archaeon Cl-PHB]